jgi:hypothetical protein
MTGRLTRALPGASILGAALALLAAPPSALAESTAAPRYSYQFALPASAFSLREACPLDPFAVSDAPTIERRLLGRCRGDAGLGGLTALDGSGQVARWRVDHQWAAQPADSWSARVRLRLGAAVNGAAGAMPLAPLAELAAGLWWQPAADWAMSLRFGQRVDAGASVQRAELTGAWRLDTGRLLFARWADDGAEQRPELGRRWWLLRRVAFLDLAWPARGDQPEGARLSLQWKGFQL